MDVHVHYFTSGSGEKVAVVAGDQRAIRVVQVRAVLLVVGAIAAVLAEVDEAQQPRSGGGQDAALTIRSIRSRARPRENALGTTSIRPRQFGHGQHVPA